MGRGGVIISGLAVGVLLMSACSSVSSAVGPAGSAAPEKSGPARVPTERGSTERGTTESVRVGRLTEAFDTPLPSTPARASVIEGFRTAMVLWDQAEANVPQSSPVLAYVTGDATTNLADAIVSLKRDKIVSAGTDRFFDTRVTVLSGTSATITSCDDDSRFQVVNAATGAPEPSFMPHTLAAEQYLFTIFQMVRLDGHWAISAVSPVAFPNSRAIACMPLPGPPSLYRRHLTAGSWRPGAAAGRAT
jgi:hypothetical protein